MKVVASESRVGSRMYVPPESSDTSSKKYRRHFLYRHCDGQICSTASLSTVLQRCSKALLRAEEDRVDLLTENLLIPRKTFALLLYHLHAEASVPAFQADLQVADSHASASAPPVASPRYSVRPLSIL